MTKPLVAIFARAPRYGAVKTRLARDIGTAETLRFYRNTLSNLVRVMSRDTRFDTVIAVTPDTAANAPGCWPPGARIATQGAGDLGRRMIRALRSAGARPAVVIGSDIPNLGAAHIDRAFRALGEAPVVLGPARDGGYWLIGARHPLRLAPNVLDGVRWSGPDATADSVARLGRVAILDTVLDDIDDGAAYRSFLDARRSS